MSVARLIPGVLLTVQVRVGLRVAQRILGELLTAVAQVGLRVVPLIRGVVQIVQERTVPTVVLQILGGLLIAPAVA